jgi:HK97 family phage major capsid protein
VAVRHRGLPVCEETRRLDDDLDTGIAPRDLRRVALREDLDQLAVDHQASVRRGAHFITGSGTNQPNGVVTAIKANSGTAVQGTAGLTSDNLIDLQYAVIESYANNGYWMMRRATEGKVRKIQDSDGQYLWQPSLQVGSPNLLLGRPIVTDPTVAAVGSANMSVIFGDFSAYVIRDVSGVRIERSDDFAFSSDVVSWRAILRTDGDLLDTTGAIKGLDTDTA